MEVFSQTDVMVNDSGNQSETKSEIKTAMTTKNKWLYPTDNLGKLEKGVEFESKIYLRDKKDTNSQDFTIL